MSTPQLSIYYPLKEKYKDKYSKYKDGAREDDNNKPENDSTHNTNTEAYGNRDGGNTT